MWTVASLPARGHVEVALVRAGFLRDHRIVVGFSAALRAVVVRAESLLLPLRRDDDLFPFATAAAGVEPEIPVDGLLAASPMPDSGWMSVVWACARNGTASINEANRIMRKSPLIWIPRQSRAPGVVGLVLDVREKEYAWLRAGGGRERKAGQEGASRARAFMALSLPRPRLPASPLVWPQASPFV